MSRIPTAVVLLTTLALCAAGEMGADSRSVRNPGDFWMVPEGRALIQAYSVERNGEIVVNGSVRMTYSAPVALNGRLLYPQISKGSFRRRDGNEFRPKVTAYYAIDDSQVTTVATRAADGSLEWEIPYVDLREPLANGASWAFRSNYYSKNWEVREEVEWDVTTEVVSLAETVDVPAGNFSGCLHTREHHHSAGLVVLREGKQTGTQVFLEATIDRWWSPGYNTVKQIEMQSTVSYAEPHTVLAKFITRWELKRVDGP